MLVSRTSQDYVVSYPESKALFENANTNNYGIVIVSRATKKAMFSLTTLPHSVEYLLLLSILQSSEKLTTSWFLPKSVLTAILLSSLTMNPLFGISLCLLIGLIHIICLKITLEESLWLLPWWPFSSVYSAWKFISMWMMTSDIKPSLFKVNKCCSSGSRIMREEMWKWSLRRMLISYYSVFLKNKKKM